eukprot:scaffold27129_cov73-Attheya_sp.AAC.8
MATPPSSDTVDTITSIIQGVPIHTTHDPNAVAVAMPLVMRENYRPSKPTTLATMVTSKQPMMATTLRPKVTATIHAAPPIIQDVLSRTSPDTTCVVGDWPMMATPLRHLLPPMIATAPPNCSGCAGLHPT